jgi:hypothetical protein
MKKLLLLPLIFISFLSLAQSEEGLVQETITTLFDGMRNTDSTLLSSLFADKSTVSTFLEKDGKTIVKTQPATGFIAQAGKPHKNLWDEHIHRTIIHVDPPMATAWTSYSFYLNDQKLHCGVNTFLFVKKGGKYLIQNISDTRKKEDCESYENEDEAYSDQINAFIDQWHFAAATADEDVFFGSMTKDGIYLGTDDSERWLRDELKSWARSAFDREVAWDFKPHSREVYFSEDLKTAWFEEKLDTWMGPCRGSGVLIYKNKEWKITHYNLAVTVPNDAVTVFKTLVEKYTPNDEK